MKKKEAEDILYMMWENGLVPSNFTEDHSEYSDAVIASMKVDKSCDIDIFIETISDLI